MIIIIISSCRNCGKGVFEMIHTFENFDKEILNMPLPYKYVIHSPKEKESDDCYEYLHAHSTRWMEFNRCLSVPVEDRHFSTGTNYI